MYILNCKGWKIRYSEPSKDPWDGGWDPGLGVAEKKFAIGDGTFRKSFIHQGDNRYRVVSYLKRQVKKFEKEFIKHKAEFDRISQEMELVVSERASINSRKRKLELESESLVDNIVNNIN